MGDENRGEAGEEGTARFAERKWRGNESKRGEVEGFVTETRGIGGGEFGSFASPKTLTVGNVKDLRI